MKFERHEVRVLPTVVKRVQQLRDRHGLTMAETWRLIIAAGITALERPDVIVNGGTVEMSSVGDEWEKDGTL